MVTSALDHQIGSPLAAVVTNIDNALDVLPDASRGDLAEVRAALEDAAAAAGQVARLVRSLTTFVRGARHERRKMAIADLLDDAIRVAGPRIRASAAFVTRVDATPPVTGDERLVTVLVTLLENAASSLTLDMGNEVGVRTYTDAGRAVVEVTDTGAGIAPADMPRIFDPTFVADATSPCGLGLWICREIVEELGGEITVESDLGRGTKVRIALPGIAK
jgi:two-component system C4-dicarboxylate transport sensor histidine kinase DctB